MGTKKEECQDLDDKIIINFFTDLSNNGNAVTNLVKQQK